jgi:uncharacterized Zn finger protein (UPF0148 family)
MSAWTCPECRGGFPAPSTTDDGAKECPWCGEQVGHVMTDMTLTPRHRAETRVVKKEDEDGPTLLEKLLGPMN